MLAPSSCHRAPAQTSITCRGRRISERRRGRCVSQRKENLLLASLPGEERERLDPFLEWREVEFKETLIEPDGPIRLVFFPYDCVTSTIQEMNDGSVIEVGLM